MTLIKGKTKLYKQPVTPTNANERATKIKNKQEYTKVIDENNISASRGGRTLDF